MPDEAEEIREEIEKLHEEPVEELEEEEEEEEVEQEEVEAEEEVVEDEPEDEEAEPEAEEDSLAQVDSWADAPADLKKAIRRDREKLKEQSQQMAEQKGQINAILQEMQERKAAEVPAEETPDRELEPEEYAAYTADKTAKAFAEFKQEQEMLQAVNITKQRLTEAESGYDQADYQDAKRFAMTAARNSLRQNNPTMTDMQVESVLDKQVAELVAGAMKQDVNPAETIYRLASQAGYKARSGQPQTDLNAIGRNQAKSKSMGSAAGSSIKTTMTRKDLISMSGEEMLEFKQNHKDAFEDIMVEGFTKRQIKKQRSRK